MTERNCDRHPKALMGGVDCPECSKGEDMNEKLWERIQKIADVLHWLDKYDECNALVMAARLMRANNIESLEEWAKFVEAQEHYQSSQR